MLYQKICEGSQYTGYECVIKVNGKPAKLDGAYCLDPTHPGTKEFISREVQNKKKEGFEYLKVDFTSNGMVQADSYYNKDVTTAVEAYNEGSPTSSARWTKANRCSSPFPSLRYSLISTGTHAVSLATLGARSDSRNTA